MNKFLLKLLPFAAVIVVYFSINAGFFYLTWKKVPPFQDACIYKKGIRKSKTTIHVIGCSNLQHNIDFEKVQSDIANRNIDFYYFSASQNSSYLSFIVNNMDRKEGDKFLLYMPYDLYKEANTFANNPYFYSTAISRHYLQYLVKENPFLVFGENWCRIFLDVKNNNYPNPVSTFRSNDPHMDSLQDPLSDYSACKNIFKRDKHIVGKPGIFSKADGRYINKLFGEKNYYVLLSPVPKIPEHYLAPNENVNKIFSQSGLNEPLNSYESILTDTTYFYDQWYHLNKCGRERETESLIAVLKLIEVQL